MKRKAKAARTSKKSRSARAVANGRPTALTREENFGQYLDIANVIFLALDLQGRVAYINRFGAQFLGWDPKEIIGQSWFDHFLPESERPAVREVFRRILDGELETLESYENPVKTKDGEQRLVLWQNAILRGDDGSPSVVLSSGQDVTDQRRLENELREREERYRLLVEEAMQGLIIYQGDPMRVVYASPAFAAFLGYEVDELLALPPEAALGLIHPDDRAQALDRYRRRLAGEEIPVLNEIRAIHRDGSTRWVRILASRVLFHGQPADQVAVLDISEQRRAAEALRQNLQRLEIVHEIERAILQNRDAASIVHQALRQINDLLGCQRSSLVQFDFSAREVETLGVVDKGGDLVSEGFRFSMDDYRMPEIVEDGQPDIIDIEALQDRLPLEASLLAAGVRVYANLPLIAGGSIFGSLNIGFSSRSELSEEKLGVAREIADSLSVALQQARLYAEEHKRLQRLGALYEASLEINAAVDAHSTLQRITAQAAELLPADAVIAFVSEPDEKQVRCAAGHHAPETWVGECWPYGDGAAGMIAQSGNPLLVVDYENWRGRSAVRPGPAEWSSMIGAPMLFQEEVLGVICGVRFRGGQPFEISELELLRLFSTQAAAAYRNIRLREDISAGRQRLQDLSRQLVEAQETERRAVARELHDEIGQLLTGLKLTLEMGKNEGPEALVQNLREADEIVSELLQRTRDMSLDLRPAMLDDLGLHPAVNWLVERYRGQTGVEVHIEADAIRGVRFPQEVETGAYRLIQEGLTNIARHAQVDWAQVSVGIEDGILRVRIADKGAGFDPGRVFSQSATSGLTGMRERVNLLGGSLSIESAPGKGTVLEALFPLDTPIDRRSAERNP